MQLVGARGSAKISFQMLNRIHFFVFATFFSFHVELFTLTPTCIVVINNSVKNSLQYRQLFAHDFAHEGGGKKNVLQKKIFDFNLVLG